MSCNVYIGGKAEFADGSKWNLLYLADREYLNGFPLKFEHSAGNGAFILSESQAKGFWSDDFAAWFALTACSGLYVGEPEKGGPKILTKLTAFVPAACRGACEATSANGRFMCSLKAVFECMTCGYAPGLGGTFCYRYGQSGALVEFRIAMEKGVPPRDPRRVLFDEWPRIFNDVSMKEENDDGA